MLVHKSRFERSVYSPTSRKFPLLKGSLLLALFGALLFTPHVGHATPPDEIQNQYRLTWSDEFNGTKLDTEKWVYRTDSKMWSTQKPENVTVADGKLQLNVKKESAGDKNYTGAGIISKKTFKYGYYEARFKVPAGAGWHTSFWLQKHDGSGGTGSKEAVQELDICENDSVGPKGYGINVHQWNPQPHKSFGHKYVTTPDLSAEFHVWGCEFKPETVKFYFDGKLVQTVDATAFPHGEMHIWLTTIASSLGGTKAVDDSKLPSAAEYDYVRYYAYSPK